MNFPSKRIAIFFAGCLAAFGIVFFFAPQIIVHAAARTHGFDISYQKLTWEPFKVFEFDKLKLTEKKSGIGLIARHAVIRPEWSLRSPARLSVDFEMDDVRLLKESERKDDAFDSLSGLASAPFSGSWVYKTVRGGIDIKDGVISVRSLAATSDEIKFNLSGTFSGSSKLELDVVIYFSGDLTRKIPDELSSVVLNEEADKWKSLSIHVGGDYGTPSIQVSSKLFRLNIKSVTR